MQDFNFCIPTRFIVGEGSPAKVGAALKDCGAKRILVVHDGGSYLAKLLETVKNSIAEAGLTALEMEEKATRPLWSLVQKGVAFVRENNVDFVLAVGGGTVMDTAKGIGFFAENDGHLTEYVLYRKYSPKCMPVGAIVTLNGTGSEVSATAMIMDDSSEPAIKYPLFQDSLRFRFAIMDPTLTYSLPIRHSLAGAFDAVTHIMEHYFCGKSGYDLQDRMCEGVMASILKNMQAVKADPTDYEVRAQLQMGATLANSTLLGLGCDSDWAVHYMENPVTTMTHELHGATLAIIAPAWMRYCYKRDLPKAVHFAERVIGVQPGESDEATALAGIDAFEALLKELGLPTRLSDIGVGPDMFEELASRSLETAGQERVGGVSHLAKDEIVAIYRLAE